MSCNYVWKTSLEFCKEVLKTSWKIRNWYAEVVFKTVKRLGNQKCLLGSDWWLIRFSTWKLLVHFNKFYLQFIWWCLLQVTWCHRHLQVQVSECRFLIPSDLMFTGFVKVEIKSWLFVMWSRVDDNIIICKVRSVH